MSIRIHFRQTVPIILIVVAILLLQSCSHAGEQEDFTTTKQQNTLDAWDAFLTKHPKGQHTSAAKEAFDNLLFQQATASSSKPQAFEAIFKRCKTSAVAEKVFKMWDDATWNIAKSKNSKKEIKRALYERIVSAPSLELCKDYLERYSDGPHKQQVIVKMEPCLFDQAMRTNNIDTYLEYLDNYPEGYRDNEIKERLNALIFTKLDVKEDFEKFEEYLRPCPKDKPTLMARMEPLILEWAKNANTVESYEKYLEEYPKGPHLQEVRTFLEPLLFKKAQEEDWYSTYEDYIKKCPNGQSVQKARERIAWLKANKAIVEIEYPKVRESGYCWQWDIFFKEKSGKIGFRVSGSGHIIDSTGGYWSNLGHIGIDRGSVNVKAGSLGRSHYRCGNGSHAFCNGCARFIWTGEDAGGHPITLVEEVKLQHTNCPMPKK